LPAGASEWVPFLLQREWRCVLEPRTVAAGDDRSFLVDANGALLACGEDGEGYQGLLGLREGTSQAPSTVVVPIPLPSLVGICIRTVVCGDFCNLALGEAGQVFAWGFQVDPSVYEDICWSKHHALVPTVMEELRNHRVRQVAPGHNHCAAVTEDGSLFTWETARRGDTMTSEPMPELGYGSFVHNIGAPYRVFALEGIRIASVALGTRFTVAVTEAGEVYSFGLGGGCLGHGEGFGEGVFLPKRIEALDGIHVASVVAGAFHALALTGSGRVYSWAHSDGLQYNSDGDGSNTEHVDCSIPQLITALLGERVRAVGMGPYTSLAVIDTGALYTWGENRFGNLGHGDEYNRNRPTLVQGLHGIPMVAVSASFHHTLAVIADGSVYVFGEGPGLGISIDQGGEGEKGNEATLSPLKILSLVCMVPS
jgi:alpha-tubulin suppressor-like RCC1 family protein